MSSFFTQGVSADRVNVITSSGGTTALTSSSVVVQQVVGTNEHTITLPDASASNLVLGRFFHIMNRTDKVVFVRYQDNSLAALLAPNSDKTFYLISNSANGTWNIEALTDKVADEYTAGEALGANEAVYASIGVTDGGRTVGRAYKTDPSIYFRKDLVGFTLHSAAVGERVLVQKIGRIPNFTGLTAGAIHYLDPTTPGGLVDTEPTTASDWIVQVGSADGTGTILDTVNLRQQDRQVDAYVADGVLIIDTDAAPSPTVLTYGSKPAIRLIGDSTHTIRLITGTTPQIGRYFHILNRSSKLVRVEYVDTSLADNVEPNVSKTFRLTENSANGTWDIEENHEVIYEKFVAGETIAINQALYISTSGDGGRTAGRAYLTEDNSDIRNKFIGFAINAVTAGQTVYVQSTGIRPGFSGLTAGDYYLSNTPGAIQVGVNTIRVGSATSTSEIAIVRVGGVSGTGVAGTLAEWDTNFKLKDGPNYSVTNTANNVIQRSALGTACATNFCAATLVQSPTVCGTTTVSAPNVIGAITCGTTCLRGPTVYGSTLVCGATVCATSAVCSPTVCGTTIARSPTVYGSTLVCGATVCGTSVVRGATVCGSSALCSAGAYSSTTTAAPNLNINSSGLIQRSTFTALSGSGTSGCLAQWTGTSTLGDGPAYTDANTPSTIVCRSATGTIDACCVRSCAFSAYTNLANCTHIFSSSYRVCKCSSGFGDNFMSATFCHSGSAGFGIRMQMLDNGDAICGYTRNTLNQDVHALYAREAGTGSHTGDYACRGAVYGNSVCAAGVVGLGGRVGVVGCLPNSAPTSRCAILGISLASGTIGVFGCAIRPYSYGVAGCGNLAGVWGSSTSGLGGCFIGGIAPFTGVHISYIACKDLKSICDGMTLSSCGRVFKSKDLDETTFGVKISQNKDKSAVGIFTSKKVVFPEWLDKNDLPEDVLPCAIMSLGEGQILVCNEGGNIEPGDFLMVSNLPGHCSKQDSESFKNYTVAKSTENIDWDIGEFQKLEFEGKEYLVAKIGCTFHCG